MKSNYDYIVSAFTSYNFYWWFKLWMITTSVCSYGWWSSILCAFYHGGKGKERWKMCVANDFYFSWDLSSHFSPRCWRPDLDSGLIPSFSILVLSPSSHPFALPLFLSHPLPVCAVWICLNLSLSLSLYLHRLCSETSVCKLWAGVCPCSCFLVCVTCLLLNADHKSLTSLQPLSKALWY